MAKERKEVVQEYRLPKRPINEIFLSLNGNPEDFAFRGIKNSWKKDWEKIKKEG